jgi:hypothetical protein
MAISTMPGWTPPTTIAAIRRSVMTFASAQPAEAIWRA